MDDQHDGGHDRGDHAGDRDLIAAPGGRRVVHQVQAENEAGRGREVDQLDDGVEGAGHLVTLPAVALPLADAALPLADAALPFGLAATAAGADPGTAAGAAGR